jgi:hypothetical protein
MKTTSKLLISVLFLSGIIFNLFLHISPAFSHEGHSHSRHHKGEEEVKTTKNNDKTTEDKKEETKKEKHENHQNY